MKISHYLCSFSWQYHLVQVRPKKICSQIGLCAFDGTRGVRLGCYLHTPILSFDCSCRLKMHINMAEFFLLFNDDCFIYDKLQICMWNIFRGYKLIFLLMKIGLYSMGIESVVHERSGRSSGLDDPAMCSACEMTVVWMQHQLRQNQTQDRILNYVNEVWSYFIQTHGTVHSYSMIIFYPKVDWILQRLHWLS